MDSITVKAYGKLNLYLDITGRREDGYHLLRSVMQSVSVYDTLVFSLGDGDGVKLICDTPGFPLDDSNLICKAYDLFMRRAGVASRGGLTVTVDKCIPSMAGMAGGSADCAAALTALNELYGFPLDSSELLELGARLGADVPFTMTGGTVLCEGIGDLMTKLDDVKDIYFAVVRPNVQISTPAAYKAYDALTDIDKESFDCFSKALKANDIKLLSETMFNALEAAVQVPEIAAVKEKMLSGGALGAMMTGSGSAVFGVFDDRAAAERFVEGVHDHPFAMVLDPVPFGIEIMR